MPKVLVIGVDIQDLRVAMTGTKTYLEELCKQFKKMESDELKFHFFDSPQTLILGKNKFYKILSHLSFHLWKQFILPYKTWKNGCDILFCTDNFVPFIKFKFKTIPVFHDAFIFEDPEHYNRLWVWLYRLTAIPAARRSAMIITPTHYAKRQIIKYTGFIENKLINISEGPKSLSFQPNHLSDEWLTRLDLRSKKYILHVGLMSKRKNLPALIRAFKKLKDQNHDELKLVLVGKIDDKQYSNDFPIIKQTIIDCELENEVILTGYLNNRELSIIYAHALMYVFPSTNEGFGIPILEAFYFKIPVLVANNTCLPEVGGDAVISFDPYSDQDIYEKMNGLISDSELQTRLINKGKHRLKEFSWEKTAKELVRIFRQIA
jgi:glycosyltransferase involved in cell wall biosynthesis